MLYQSKKKPRSPLLLGSTTTTANPLPLTCNAATTIMSNNTTPTSCFPSSSISPSSSHPQSPSPSCSTNTNTNASTSLLALSLPSFEKSFRNCILRPLQNNNNNNNNNSTAGAGVVVNNSNNSNNNNTKNTNSKPQTPPPSTSLREIMKAIYFHALARTPSCTASTSPSCTFFLDPTSEDLARNKLLPQVMKLLLQQQQQQQQRFLDCSITDDFMVLTCKILDLGEVLQDEDSPTEREEEENVVNVVDYLGVDWLDVVWRCVGEGFYENGDGRFEDGGRGGRGGMLSSSGSYYHRHNHQTSNNPNTTPPSLSNYSPLFPAPTSPLKDDLFLSSPLHSLSPNIPLHTLSTVRTFLLHNGLHSSIKLLNGSLPSSPSPKSHKRPSISTFQLLLNTIRSIKSIISTPSPLLSPLFETFHSTSIAYLQTVKINEDISTSSTRRIYLEIMDHFSLELKLSSIWKFLNSDILQIRIAGLNELRNRIVECLELQQPKPTSYRNNTNSPTASPAHSTSSTAAHAESDDFSNDESNDANDVQTEDTQIETLVHWMTIEHSLLQHLLSPSHLHPELLKRCFIIPSFLSDQNALKEEDVLLLWNAAFNSSHESIQHAVLDLIASLLDKFTLEQLLVLERKFSELTEWNSQSLNLLYQFCSVSLGLGSTSGSLGLELLWKLCRETTPLNCTMHEVCISHILTLLPQILLPSLKDKFLSIQEMNCNLTTSRMFLLQQSLSGMKSDETSVPCHLILHTLLRLWPERTRVSDIIRDNEMVNVIVEDLCRYVQMAKKKTKTGKKNLDGEVLVGRFYSHAVVVNSHLELLKFVLGICFKGKEEEVTAAAAAAVEEEKGPTPILSKMEVEIVEEESNEAILIEDDEDKLENGMKPFLQVETSDPGRNPLSPTHIESLWSTLVENGLTDQESDLCLSALHSILLSTDTHPVLRVHLSPILFQYCLKRLDPSVMRLAAFDLFILTMAYCNLLEGRYEVFLPSTPSSSTSILLGSSPTFQNLQIRLTSFDILGLEKLWTIALFTNDHAVSQKAMLYLSTLHTHSLLSPNLKPLLAKQHEEFIRHCMSTLPQQTKRTLILLQTFLRQIISPHFPSHGYITSNLTKLDHLGHFTVKIQPIGSEPFELRCKNRSTVGYLRREIRNFIAANKHQDYRLIFRGKELLQEHQLLTELGIEDGAAIHCCARMSKVLEVPRHETPKERKIKAVEELCLKENFSRLFDLLCSEREDLRELIWDLVQLLPTDPSLKMKLRELEDVEWDEWMPSRECFKLLYSLQVVEALAVESVEDGMEKEWSRRFERRGGIAHLLKLFLEMKFDKEKELDVLFLLRSCHRLMRLIVFFFESGGDGLGGGKEVAKRALVVLNWSVNVQKQYYLPPPKSTLSHPSDHAFLPETGLPTSTPPPSPSPNTPTQSSQDIFSESGAVARQSLSLIRLLYSQTSTLLPILFQPSSKDLLSQGIASALIKSPSEDVRSLALNTFRNIFLENRRDVDLCIKLLEVLVKLLPLGRDLELMERSCCRLFYLVGDLIVEVWNDASDDEKRITLEKLKESRDQPVPAVPVYTCVTSTGPLLHWISTHITTLPIREKRRSSHPVDYYLVGLLKLTDKLLNFLPHESLLLLSPTLLPHLFHDCLFSLPTSSDHGSLAPPKCKTQPTREAALNLLTTLSTHPTNFHALTTLLQTHHHDFTQPPRTDLLHEWNIDPPSRDKHPSGHVGLRNLGATCYLNSLLQQLFLIKPLRNGVLECTSSSELLYQLQLLFANLLSSERRDYDTSGLCDVLKGYDGNPIRPGEQQDVDEFFNLFGERLETQLKDSPEKDLLKNIFGGEICHVIICRECRHRSERMEECLSLSLDVKGKRNILESLKLYIRGEALDGDNQYFCENCQRKRDSIKMCCVSKLPNTLILHLKRFEFDLELMRKMKINDRCEFPIELDMKPYTREGLMSQNEIEEFWTSNEVTMRDDGYYRYTLRGVLVHSGTADSGHYYSLAKSEEEGWYCFNDSCVTPFDPETLASATFGGMKTSNKYDNVMQKMVRTETAKPYSAYLLIYERDGETMTEMEDDNEAGKPNSVAVDATKNSDTSSSSITSKENRSMPTEIFNQLWKENDRFLRDQIFYSLEYCNFLLEISKLHTPPTLPTIQILTHYLFEFLLHAKDRRSQCESLSSLLSSRYEQSEEACRWLLKLMTGEYKFWAEAILLRCPALDSRREFCRVLSVVFRRLAPVERKLYNVEEDDCSSAMADSEEEEEEGGGCDVDDDIVITPLGNSGTTTTVRIGRAKWWKSRSVLAKFVGMTLLELLPGCECHWRRFDQLFECIRGFAEVGHEEALYLIRCGLVLRLVDLYLGDNGGVPQKSLLTSQPSSRKSNNHGRQRRSKMGDKYTKPNLHPLLSLVDLLIRSAVIMPEDEEDDDSDVESDEKAKEKRSEEPSKQPSYLLPPSLTTQARLQSALTRFELPRRDAASVSTKKFLQSLFEEPPKRNPSIAPTSTSSSSFPSSSSSLSSFPSLSEMLVKRIVSHICFENLETSKLVCDIGQRFLEDRKADEFLVALDALFSLLSINDSRVSDRIQPVMNALIAGITSNIPYEKESTVTLNGLKSLLLNRTGGKRGSPSEVTLHTWMMENLKSQFVEEWYQRPYTSPDVKMSIVGVMRALLPRDGERKRGVEKLEFGEGKKRRRRGKVKETLKETMKDKEVVRIDEDSVFEHSQTAVDVDVNVESNSNDNDVVILGVVNSPGPGVIAQNNAPNNEKKRNESKSSGKSRSTFTSITTTTTMPTSIPTSIPSSFTTTTSPSPCHSLPYQPPNLTLHHLFTNLITLFPLVSEDVRTQVSQGTCKSTRNNNHPPSSTVHYHPIIDTTAFAEYFETLRLVLTGDEYEKKHLLHKCGGIHRELVNLLWKIDEEGRAEQRPAADIAKGEILQLYERMVTLHSELGDELLSNFELPTTSSLEHDNENENENEDSKDNSSSSSEEAFSYNKRKKLKPTKKLDEIQHLNKLLEIFVTSVQGNETYNARYMSHYYSLLLLLADRHPLFRRKLLDHNNWRWSLRAFVLSGIEFHPLTDIIFEGTSRHLKTDPEFRKLLLEYLVTDSCENQKRSLITQTTRLETRTLQLLLQILECDTNANDDKDDQGGDDDDNDNDEEEHLIAIFSNETYRGMSQLSASVEKFHSSPAKSAAVLKGLSLSLECMCHVLNSYGMNRIRLLIRNWPEVDDVNLICTQIVTRTEEEWESVLLAEEDNNNGAGGEGMNSVQKRVESMRVVEVASELLKILASAEAVAEAEAE